MLQIKSSSSVLDVRMCMCILPQHISNDYYIETIFTSNKNVKSFRLGIGERGYERASHEMFVACASGNIWHLFFTLFFILALAFKLLPLKRWKMLITKVSHLDAHTKKIASTQWEMEVESRLFYALKQIQSNIRHCLVSQQCSRYA